MTGRPLRLVTWNVHSFVGRDRRQDPARCGAVLAGLDADVVALQEVDGRTEDGGEPLAQLGHSLGLETLAGPNLVDERGEYGNGLLTRLRPRSVERVDLSVAGREPRGALDVVLQGPAGDALRVVVTHLGLRRSERREQARRIRSRLCLDPHLPTVLLGDLNDWRPTWWGSRLLEPEPFPWGTRGATFPSWRPLLGLDRVLARPAPLRARERVEDSPLARSASDHLPVLVELEWPVSVLHGAS